MVFGVTHERCRCSLRSSSSQSRRSSVHQPDADTRRSPRSDRASHVFHLHFTSGTRVPQHRCDGPGLLGCSFLLNSQLLCNNNCIFAEICKVRFKWCIYVWRVSPNPMANRNLDMNLTLAAHKKTFLILQHFLFVSQFLILTGFSAFFGFKTLTLHSGDRNMISVLWCSLALGLWLIRHDGFHLLRLTDSSYYGLSLLH